MATNSNRKIVEKYRVETECVNQLAELQYALTVPSRFSAQMQARNVDLLDVFHVMKHGQVVSSGMRDRAGLWVVRGILLDGESLDVTLTFRFSELHVELLDLA